MNGEIDYGLIYVLTNKWMPGLVKIGKTTKKSVEDRMKSLYYGASGVPVNFECSCAFKVPLGKLDSLEKSLHKYFKDKRVNPDREFFQVLPEDVQKLFWAYNKITEDATSEVQQEIDKVTIADEKLHKRPKMDFFKMGLKKGDVLIFKKDTAVYCSVSSKNLVNFGDLKDVSLTSITKELLKFKYNVQPSLYWIVKDTNCDLLDLYNETYSLS